MRHVIPKHVLLVIPALAGMCSYKISDDPAPAKVQAAVAPEPPPPPPRLLKAGRPLRADELNPPLISKADEVLWKLDAPYGTEVLIEVDGQKYIARFEEHFHEPGGPLKPWGPHKGVTLYTAE